MVFHDFLFLLVVLLLLSLVLLGRLSWLHLQCSHSSAGSRRALVHRLLKPRTPLDCPICRLSSSGVRPAHAPVRPWREVKSRRGAPKRIPTAGFACPNQQCLYFGITDADIHALVGDGKHGHKEFLLKLIERPYSKYWRKHSLLKKILLHLFEKWLDASIATDESFMNVIQLPAMRSQHDTRSIDVDEQKSECNCIVMKSEACPLLCVPLGHQFHIIMSIDASRDQCAFPGRNSWII